MNEESMMLCTSDSFLFSAAYTAIYGVLPPILLIVGLVFGIAMRKKFKQLHRGWLYVYIITFVAVAVIWIYFLFFSAGGPCPSSSEFLKP